MEVVRQQTEAESLLGSASQELRDMIDNFKRFYMDLKVMYESIRTKAHKEGFTDPEVYVIMKHVTKDMPITAKERSEILKPLRPIKDMTGLDKITTSAGSMQEVTLIRCNLKDVDKDIKRAKQRLCDAIMESEEWWDAQIMGTIIGIISDQQS